MKTILEYYNNLIKFSMNNLAFTITVSNVVFLILILIIKDPFGIRNSSYEKAAPFFQGNIQSINSIAIEKSKLPDSKFELKKENDTWFVSAKSKLIPADNERVDTLLKSIANARKYTKVTSSKDKSDEYGFNEDEVKVEIFENGNSAGFILVGSVVSNDANSSHIKWKDSDDIYLVEENIKAATNRGEYVYFFNKKVSPDELTSDNIIGITLKKASNNYEIRKTTTWSLINPKKGELANEDMSTTLSKLASVNSDDIVLDESILTGIDPNPFELKIDFKGKDGIPKSYSILSAGFDKKINAYYVRKNNEPTVYKLSEYSIKSLLDFKPETLVK